MEAIEQAASNPPAAASSAWGRSVVALSDGVDRVCTFAFVIATVAFAVIMLVGVFFRYVLNDSLAWSDEVALMVFNWAILLAIASGYLHDKHVNLDLAGAETLARPGHPAPRCWRRACPSGTWCR